MLLKRNKAIVYIDGFNLYYGLKKAIHYGYNKKCKWLDISGLAADLIPHGYNLVKTKYFTSRVSGDPRTSDRQSAFIDAVSSLPNVEIFYGQFHRNQQYCNHQDCKSKMICKKCGRKYLKNNEKRTDVNIATEMLIDAFRGDFDAAVLVGADSDLIPPILKIKSYFKRKKVFAAFPPNRFSRDIRNIVEDHRKIRKHLFEKNFLPDPFVTPAGVSIDCPPEWK